MKKLLLHIGRHKTGTSSLQRFLVENREMLKELGFHYPFSGIRGYGHHDIAQHLMKSKIRITTYRKAIAQPQFIDLFEEIDQTLSTNHIIISSEGFQNCKPSLIAKLFSAYAVEIHVYLREQAGYLLSSYTQSIQVTSNTMSLAEFERKNFSAHYDKFTNEWCKAFGISAIKVHLFNKKALINGDIIDDFLERVLDLNEKDRHQLEHHGTDQNPSLGWRLIEFKRQLNLNGFSNIQTNHKSLYKALRKMALMAKYQDKILMSSDIYNRLLSKYAQGNKKVSKRFLDTSNALDIKMPHLFSPTDTMELTKIEIGEMIKDLIEIAPDLKSSISAYSF